MKRAGELKDITIYQMHMEGAAPYADPQWEDVFKVNCFFIGANLRKAFRRDGRLHSIVPERNPFHFRNKIINIDFALIHVSIPDEHGYCSLGVSVDIAPAILETCGCIIAQVNPHMPRTSDAVTYQPAGLYSGRNDEILVAEPEAPMPLQQK
jgi:acyl-CoA hydrolase